MDQLAPKPAEMALAWPARLGLHLAVLAVLTGAVAWLAAVSNREHWGRADWLSMDGLTALVAWVVLGVDAVVSTSLVLFRGTTRKWIFLIHLISPPISLAVILSGLFLLVLIHQW